MSTPGGPFEFLHTAFGGGSKQVYPPAPAGYKYVNLDMPQAPPGYRVQRMSQIANNNPGPGSNTGARARYQYQFGAHTPEGLQERARELTRMRNELHSLSPHSRSFDSNGTPPPGVPSYDLPAVKNFLSANGAPTVQDLISQSFINPHMGAIDIPTPTTLAQKLAAQKKDLKLGNDVQKILDTLGKSGEVGTTPRGDIGMPDVPVEGPMPGLPGSDTPPADVSQSKLDERSVPLPQPRPPMLANVPLPRPRPDTPEDELWRWAEGIAKNAGAPESPTNTLGARRSMVPEILQNIWTNMTSPVGPAFDPNNVNLGEQRYNPLPEAQ